LKEEADRGFRNLYEDVEGDFQVEADTNGKIAPNFLKELRLRLAPSEEEEEAAGKSKRRKFSVGIDGLEKIDPTPGQASYVIGSHKLPDGTPKDTIIRIGPWSDEPGNRSVRLEMYDADFNRIPGSVRSVSYREFYQIIGRFTGGKIFDPVGFAERRRSVRSDIENSEVFDTPAFPTKESLERGIDVLDPDGTGIKLEPGMSFVVGKPEDNHYNFGTITGIGRNPVKDDHGNVIEATRTITFRNTLGSEQTFTFEEFFELFRSAEYSAKRLKGSLRTIDDVLKIHAQ
jgi:hypothetical protein